MRDVPILNNHGFQKCLQMHRELNHNQSGSSKIDNQAAFKFVYFIFFSDSNAAGKDSGITLTFLILMFPLYSEISHGEHLPFSFLSFFIWLIVIIKEFGHR